ncbi:hypothetical protein ONZ45_g6984 [Pleurotus djamor]|nr:hypothetical protein ONZ45_g6984 [Pleurotus djamor]
MIQFPVPQFNVPSWEPDLGLAEGTFLVRSKSLRCHGTPLDLGKSVICLLNEAHAAFHARTRVNEFVYKVPIRLFDRLNGVLLTREDLAEYLLSEIYAAYRASGDAWISTSESIRSLGKYAILSHRWGRDELTFDDLRSEVKPIHKRGWEKLIRFCDVAASFECRFVWMDTGCINKTSSSELEESIRSMFKWYQNAHVCIVYLTEGRETWKEDEWFTRGWTLQEMIAPSRLKFYQGDWTPLFDDGGYGYDVIRSEHITTNNPIAREAKDSILREISFITGIPSDTLDSYRPSPIHAHTVFHWVNSRVTTRPEDIVYCLIGLLNVQMPIAYGEGMAQAFHRLQVECVRQVNNRSIFAINGDASPMNSMLSMSFPTRPPPLITPHCLLTGSKQSLDPSFELTNAGLRIAMIIHRASDDAQTSEGFVMIEGVGLAKFLYHDNSDESEDEYNPFVYDGGRDREDDTIGITFFQEGLAVGVLGTYASPDGHRAFTIVLEKAGLPEYPTYTRRRDLRVEFTSRDDDLLFRKMPEVVFIS